MLPGLRFLFAATLISASMLIFGMGAIALMRASHQQFASAPPRQPPEPVFAQAPQTMPSLSMLRADPVAQLPQEAISELERVAALTSAARSDPVSAPTIADPTSEPLPEARGDAAPPADSAPILPDEKSITQNAPPLTTAAAPVDMQTPKTSTAERPAQIAAIPVPEEPVATGSIAMPEDQPVSEQPVAEPPLPQARPEVAAVSPVAAVTPTKITPKPVVKRKVRKAKRQRAKAERLPAVSSAPTLGSLFSSSSSSN